MRKILLVSAMSKQQLIQFEYLAHEVSLLCEQNLHARQLLESNPLLLWLVVHCYQRKLTSNKLRKLLQRPRNVILCKLFGCTYKKSAVKLLHKISLERHNKTALQFVVNAIINPDAIRFLQHTKVVKIEHLALCWRWRASLQHRVYHKLLSKCGGEVESCEKKMLEIDKLQRDIRLLRIRAQLPYTNVNSIYFTLKTLKEEYKRLQNLCGESQQSGVAEQTPRRCLPANSNTRKTQIALRDKRSDGAVRVATARGRRVAASDQSNRSVSPFTPRPTPVPPLPNVIIEDDNKPSFPRAPIDDTEHIIQLRSPACLRKESRDMRPLRKDLY